MCFCLWHLWLVTTYACAGYDLEPKSVGEGLEAGSSEFQLIPSLQ